MISVKQTPRILASRAASLQLLMARQSLESALLSDSKLKTRLKDAHSSLSESTSKLKDSLSFTVLESSLISKGLGEWDPVNHIGRIQSNWESLSTILWTLKILDKYPDATKNCDHKSVFESTAMIPALPDTITSFIDYFTNGAGKSDHLINNDLLIHEINKTEAYFWRSQAQIVLKLKTDMKSSNPPDTSKMNKQLRNLVENIETVISTASSRAMSSKLVDSIVDGDFKVDGVKYGDLSEEIVLNLAGISSRRLETFGWIVGSNEMEVEQVKLINPINALWAPI